MIKTNNPIVKISHLSNEINDNNNHACHIYLIEMSNEYKHYIIVHETISGEIVPSGSFTTLNDKIIKISNIEYNNYTKKLYSAAVNDAIISYDNILNNPFAITNFRNDNAFLSNFYECDITYNGLVFSSVEAAFQSAKCRNIADRIAFVSMTPAEAKKAGKKVAIVDNWNSIKLDIMAELINIKFNDPKLAKMLIDTGDKLLIENNTWNDTFWGISNGIGFNYLGQLLMKQRENILKKYYSDIL